MEFDYSCDQIIKCLYQGPAPPPGDFLARAGVDVLVLAAKGNQDARAYTGITVICAPGDDDERPHRVRNFTPVWHAAALQVAEHVRAGRNVLVTCMAGQNRSGIITAMALHELTGWSGERCVEHITRCRHHALNNKGFVQYLCETYPRDTR